MAAHCIGAFKLPNHMHPPANRHSHTHYRTYTPPSPAPNPHSPILPAARLPLCRWAVLWAVFDAALKYRALVLRRDRAATAAARSRDLLTAALADVDPASERAAQMDGDIRALEECADGLQVGEVVGGGGCCWRHGEEGCWVQGLERMSGGLCRRCGNARRAAG